MTSRLQTAVMCLSLFGCGHAPPPAAQQAKPERDRVCYRGTQTLTGHFELPGQTLPLEMQLELFAHAYVVSTWSADAPHDVEREQVWLEPTRVIQASADAPVAEASEWETTWARKLARLAETTQAAPHPTFGDVVERVQPGELTWLDGLSAPGTLSLAHATESTRWTAELARERCSDAATLSNKPVVPPLKAAEPPVTWTQLEAGVELAILHGSQIVSLVVELSHALLVCETGLTVRQGEQLLDALAERFPHKPVAHVLFGHHHPHYTGGLRAFIAAGAVIHAPLHNARFVEQLAALPFELAPDRLARNKLAPRIEAFEGRFVLQDEGRVVVEAIDIGSESNHTQEYVLAYLPKHKLLFEGDLGWSVGPTGEIRASRRAHGLLHAIAVHGLAVERIVQSWPLMGAKQTIEPSALQAAVEAREATALAPRPGET